MTKALIGVLVLTDHHVLLYCCCEQAEGLSSGKLDASQDTRDVPPCYKVRPHVPIQEFHFCWQPTDGHDGLMNTCVRPQHL